MPELLALEWDHDQICGVSALVSAGRVRVRRCFVLGRPAVAVAGSGPLPIDWLRSQLSAQGVAAGEVLVGLPRDEAVVKRIELPETSDDELPLLVRYQAGAKSSVPLSELSLDFIPLPRRNEVPGREVLMATVPQQTITEIRTLCETAGLQLTTLGLTPAAVAELVARAEPHAGVDLAGASLVVSKHGSRLEISVLRRCHLLFSHSARLSMDENGPEPQAIVAEVSRSLVALRGAISDVKIERVWTLLDKAAHEQLSDVLRKRLSCDVQPLDPFATVDFDRNGPEEGLDKSQFSGPIGLLLARAEPRVPAIDFLAPRQPPVKRDDRKRRRVIMAAGAGLLALLLAGNHWLTLRGLDEDIASLLDTEVRLNKEKKSGEPTVASAKLITDWEKGSVAWLDEMAVFTDRMPPTDRIYLRKLELTPIATPVTGKAKAEVRAKVKVDGVARERNDVLKLSEKLLAVDAHYRGVLPPVHGPSTEDPNFPWHFLTEVQIAEPSTKKEKAASPKPPGPEQPKPETPASPANESPPTEKTGNVEKAEPSATAPAAPTTPPAAPKVEGRAAS